jgi:hypothetical protein
LLSYSKVIFGESQYCPHIFAAFPPNLRNKLPYLAGQPFPFNSIWFAEIYVKGCIRKLFLVRAMVKVVRNTGEGVEFIIAIMVWQILITNARALS